MIKIIKYCDYCGKKLVKKNKIKIKTPWYYYLDPFTWIGSNRTYIRGDGCQDCYSSFQEWVKSRKEDKKVVR